MAHQNRANDFHRTRLKQFVGDVPFDDRFRGLGPDYLRYIEVFPGRGDAVLSPPRYPVRLYRIRTDLFVSAITLLSLSILLRVSSVVFPNSPLHLDYLVTLRLRGLEV